jgi:hypothetical protein
MRQLRAFYCWKRPVSGFRGQHAHPAKWDPFPGHGNPPFRHSTQTRIINITHPLNGEYGTHARNQPEPYWLPGTHLAFLWTQMPNTISIRYLGKCFPFASKIQCLVILVIHSVVEQWRIPPYLSVTLDWKHSSCTLPVHEISWKTQLYNGKTNYLSYTEGRAPPNIRSPREM